MRSPIRRHAIPIQCHARRCVTDRSSRRATTRRCASVLAVALASVVLCSLVAPGDALAQPETLPDPRIAPDPVPDRGDEESDRALLQRAENRVNLRIGKASSDHNERPTVCLEVRAVSRLSIEGCGTGSGLLHNAPGATLTHFRAKWGVYRRVVSRGVLQAQLGFGMTELQIDADNPGFVITPPPGGVEAVGPEASLGVRWLRPIDGGWELIINTTAGLSWIPGAGELRSPQDTVQPFVGFEIGAGW